MSMRDLLFLIERMKSADQFVWTVAPLFLSLLFVASPSYGRAQTPARSCKALAALALPTATITMAQAVQAGAFKPSDSGPNLFGPFNLSGRAEQGSNPAFCRVAATLKPSSDSNIKVEIWLPQTGWNGKFLGVGNFGWGGTIMYAGMLSGVQEGYAVANNDTGHQGGDGQFTFGHPEKLIDYAYRANHEMTVDAKLVIKAFYGVAQSRSYWIGCSLGGLQGLSEAKRYPNDYDGIVVGAPPNPLVSFNALQLWPSWLISQDPQRMIPKSKYAMVHAAVVKACASAIGQRDNLVDQPDKCTFDPKSLKCKGADSLDCLTAPQVYLLQQTYAGPTNPSTGVLIFPGPARGTELEMFMFAKAAPMSVALDLFRYAAFQNPDWVLLSMDWDKSVTEATRRVGALLHIDDNLKPFFDHGGKLMFYIGWADYHNPEQLVDYYKSLIKNSGDKAPSSVRLFAIPGMAHCGGGEGCDTFNRLGAIDEWVERGKAPERMLATKVRDGRVLRSRPLCAYPEVTKYKGVGDPNNAANFACAKNGQTRTGD